MKHIYSLVIVAVIFFSSCKSDKAAPQETVAKQESSLINITDEQAKNAGLTTGRVQVKEMSSVLKIHGRIDVPPQNMVSICMPLGGYLKSTKLLPGMHVRKGETIAVIEDQQYIQLQQDYLSAKARIGYLENEYMRQKELNQSKASSDKVYQQAEADYRSQKVLMTALAEKLLLLGISPNDISESKILRSINTYSPINGYVTKVNVNVGKYVSPTEVLFELVNPLDIHLALKVFEKDLDKLTIGQTVMAYTNGHPEKKYVCTILLIGKDLTADGYTDVHCHFETYDKVLVPGTYMNAEVRINNANVQVLPTDAIVSYEGKNYVYIAKGKSIYEMKEVQTGQVEGAFTEVSFSDIQDISGADFVTNGAYSLLMMMKNGDE